MKSCAIGLRYHLLSDVPLAETVWGGEGGPTGGGVKKRGEKEKN